MSPVIERQYLGLYVSNGNSGQDFSFYFILVMMHSGVLTVQYILPLLMYSFLHQKTFTAPATWPLQLKWSQAFMKSIYINTTIYLAYWVTCYPYIYFNIIWTAVTTTPVVCHKWPILPVQRFYRFYSFSCRVFLLLLSKHNSCMFKFVCLWSPWWLCLTVFQFNILV